MKTLSQLAPKIVEKESGKNIPFAEFLEDHAANGELFTSDISAMLDSALNPHTEWNEVDDYFVPIAHQVITEAAQHEDKRIYLRLVLAIREAWQDLNLNLQHTESR
ncbi:hypothetical protein P9847_01375 [Paenibacillus chibensis]|uniref:Uncharacterized protein n=1 Tax=Paenibacillus chibensis TaxID=59846 RepID=A0ABU6PNI5_9BACL|nr:hypothetical protein [Paenibacillus chibensis]